MVLYGRNGQHVTTVSGFQGLRLSLLLPAQCLVAEACGFCRVLDWWWHFVAGGFLMV